MTHGSASATLRHRHVATEKPVAGSAIPARKLLAGTVGKPYRQSNLGWRRELVADDQRPSRRLGNAREVWWELIERYPEQIAQRRNGCPLPRVEAIIWEMREERDRQISEPLGFSVVPSDGLGAKGAAKTTRADKTKRS